MTSVINKKPLPFKAAEKGGLEKMKAPSKFDRFFDVLGKEYRRYSPRWKVNVAC